MPACKASQDATAMPTMASSRCQTPDTQQHVALTHATLLNADQYHYLVTPNDQPTMLMLLAETDIEAFVKKGVAIPLHVENRTEPDNSSPQMKQIHVPYRSQETRHRRTTLSMLTTGPPKVTLTHTPSAF